MSEQIVLVECDRVSKKFCRNLKRSFLYGIQDVIGDVLGRDGAQGPEVSGRGGPGESGLRRDEFWANHEISLGVRRGECVGLIGRNGAGKTTLLKMLTGLIKPDAGQIRMRGRIGALIALGAGFNPVLSGRENIYVNGSILGVRKRDIDRKMDEIIEFSDLASSIDAPVRNYSSGMQVRLGFACATVLIDPDVLIVDEVLAVGDAEFQARCANRISELVSSAAVILVSHQIGWIQRLCQRAVVLDQGRVIRDGEVNESVKAYLSTNTTELDVYPPKIHTSDISNVSLRIDRDRIRSGDSATACLGLTSLKERSRAYLSLTIHRSDGQWVGQYFGKSREEYFSIREGVNEIAVDLGPLPFASGSYYAGFNLIEGSSGISLASGNRVSQFRVEGNLDSGPAIEFGSLRGVTNVGA